MSQTIRQIAGPGLAWLLMAFAAAVTAAPQASVALSLKAEKEISVTDAQGNKTLKRIGVAVLDAHGNKSTNDLDAAVVPGDEVIYTIDYANTSNDVATKVVITNPIPGHMRYEDGSAQGAGANIEFSVDGKHFAAPDRLTVAEADGTRRRAQPEDYTHVRWTLAAPLAPGKKGHVSYRAILQ